MNWDVYFTSKAKKQLNDQPKHIIEAMRSLVRDIGELGPLRYNWKNFGKLKGAECLYHCHLKKGHPTYVACWEVKDKKVKIVEVYYVGTHEKAPY